MTGWDGRTVGGTEWNAYAPALSAAGTDPTLGLGGSVSGAWTRDEYNVVSFRIVINIGSTGYDDGTGQWIVTLPTAPANAARLSFPVDYYDDSLPGRVGHGAGAQVYAGKLYLWAPPTSAGAYDRAVVPASNVPFALAVGDVITIHGSYEAA